MRSPVASPFALAGIAALFVMGFVLLPGVPTVMPVDDATETASPRHLDELGVAYLKADLANRRFTTQELDTAFAALARSGHVEEAEQLLATHRDFTPRRVDRHRLSLEAAARTWQRSGGEDSAVVRSVLLGLLDALVNEAGLHDPALLSRGLDLAIAIAVPSTTVALAHLLAIDDPAGAVARLRGCANDLSFAGQPAAALTCVQGAFSLVVDADSRFELELERLQRLVAAGARQDADDHAERLATDATSSVASRSRLAEVLLGIDRPDLAASLYATLAIDDPAQAIRWGLEAARWSESIGELDRARAVLERVLELAPRQRDAHRRLARLVEWAGDPEQALAHWRAVAAEDAATGNPSDLDALNEIARLADLTWRPAVAAEALRTRLNLGQPTLADLERLVALYERDGRPDEAARALEAFDDSVEEAAGTLVMMAELQRRHHRYRDALATWERVAERQGRTTRETVNRIEFHWRLGERGAAYRLARELESQPPAADTVLSGFQVQLVAELGWRHRRPALLHRMRPWLERIEDPDWRALVAARLVGLLAEECRPREALELAESGWRSTAAPELALLAMEQARALDEPERFSRFLQDDARTSGLDGQPLYWNLVATFHERGGRHDEAAQAWQRSLAIAPAQPDAIEGLLRLAVAHDNRATLETLVDAHREVAEVTPSLVSAFAEAEAARGDLQAAARWRARVPLESEIDTERRVCVERDTSVASAPAD